MPRSRKGGTLASYFYGVGSEVEQTPVPRNQTAKGGATGRSGFLKRGYHDERGDWIELPEEHHAPSKKGSKRKRKTNSKVRPAQHDGSGPKSEASIRHEHKVDKAMQIKHMRDHFKETDNLLEKNSSWPLHSTHTQINMYIMKCKELVKETRTHTGAGAHRLNTEAVHSKHIDVSNWPLKAWFNDIQGYAESTGIKNHLTLPSPLVAAGSSRPYVNVVLSWMFAAKRQLMADLAEYIKDAPTKTADMSKFLEHNEKGVNARKAFKQDKAFLGPKHRQNPYSLADEDLLRKQREDFHML